MKINLRESLNELDVLSNNRYDLYNTYLSKNPSLDTKKKLSEAIYKNKSPKEILMILNEDWDDEESEWTEMDSKSVRDSDGFLTDYTWYWRNNNGEDQHVFVFGDSDLYRPEDGYFDWECDSLEEAQDWFDGYVGPGDDEDDWMDESLKEAKFIEPKYKDGDVVFVGDANGYHGSFLIEGDVKNIPKELYKHIRKITKYGNLDESYYKVEYKLDSNHLFEEDYDKFFNYITPILKNAGITIIDEDELNKSKNSSKWESLNEDTSKETIKWKITYGKGRPDGEEEVVEFPTYKEAKQYAADHAKGWGFEVKKLEESLKEDTKERILHISKKEEPELRDRNSVWLQVKDENDIEKYFKTALRMAPDKIVIHDFDIDEIPKKLLTLSKSAEIPVSFDESLDESMVKVEPSEKELNQVINVLNKYGFKVDDNYKPGRGLFGSYHIQVINPDLDYIDFDQLVKDVEPVGNALDNLSFDINMPITYNFGANDDNVITGGIDIHVGYKDDSDLGESLKRLGEESSPHSSGFEGFIEKIDNTSTEDELRELYDEVNAYGFNMSDLHYLTYLIFKKMKSLEESLKEDLNINDFMEPVDQIGKAKIYYDSNKRTYFTPSLDLDFDTLDKAKDFIGAPLYMGESLNKTIVYPNGMPASDIDIHDALNFNFGLDRDMNDDNYTDEEKQRSLNYWINKMDEIDESLNEASYGGAYDIEDDMFFTKEELVEFAGDIVDQFSAWSNHSCDVENVYMDGPTTFYIGIYDYDDDVSHSAETRIDMRKIRKPSDIYKYKDRILKQLEDSYNEYHENDFEDAE